jgi:hypothetical protein
MLWERMLCQHLLGYGSQCLDCLCNVDMGMERKRWLESKRNRSLSQNQIPFGRSRRISNAEKSALECCAKVAAYANCQLKS